MITYPAVDGLLAARALADRALADRALADRALLAAPTRESAQRSVLSLYLRVPADPAELRELPARVHGLLALAGGPDRPGSRRGPDGPSRRPAGPRPARDELAAGDELALGDDLAAGVEAGLAASVEAAVEAGVEAGLAASENAARRLLEARGRDWLGHTAAIFVAGAAGDRRDGDPSDGGAWQGGRLDAVMPGDGSARAFSLPCRLPDRAVLAVRPHVRPLLLALQRCPAHYVAAVDTRHTGLFRVTGERVETVGGTAEAGQVHSPGFGGWQGLDSHRVSHRVLDLEHDHLRTTVALLERVAGGGGGEEPIVIGGHAESVGVLTGLLPIGLRDRLAGTFFSAPRAITPDVIRDLAAPVIEDLVGMRELCLAEQIRGGELRRDPLLVTGLFRCLEAVNRRAVRLLAVPAGGIVGGYACERCGALSSSGTGCADGPAWSRWVPDLFEEMAIATINDGGRVEALSDPPGEVAARLRLGVVEVNRR